MLKTIFFVLSIQCVFADTDFKVVKTAQGLVKGYKSDEGDFFEFYGIPYATAPHGRFRFRDPLPGPVWMDTIEATNRNIVCPQSKFFLTVAHKNAEIRENCLVANVYAPDTQEKKLPVVVFIHGGAYQFGYGHFKSPKALVNQGKIVAVNFNYRLGIHGFLCLGTKEAPGNAGMKDMVALLKWVKKNIANFGGNPDDVTLAGYSAGSSATELLMLSKQAKGLFHKIIPESGAATSVWSIQPDPIAKAKDFAQKFNFTSDDVYELEDFFTSTSLDLLTDLYYDYDDSTLTFAPCIERPAKTAFLQEAPVKLLQNGDFPKLPSLVGYDEKEGLLKLNVFYEAKDRMQAKFSDFLPADLKFESDDEKERVAKLVKEFYFGKENVSEKTLDAYVEYFSDVLFKYSIWRSAKLQMEAGAKSVYLYEYSYYDETSSINLVPKPESLNVPGAMHSAQTFAVLEVAGASVDESHLTEKYRQMKATMRELWINFIKNGRPVSEPTTLFPKGWPASSIIGRTYMNLDYPPLLKGGLFAERLQFWDKIYEKYYRDPIPPPKPPSRHSEL